MTLAHGHDALHHQMGRYSNEIVSVTHYRQGGGGVWVTSILCLNFEKYTTTPIVVRISDKLAVMWNVTDEMSATVGDYLLAIFNPRFIPIRDFQKQKGNNLLISYTKKIHF